MLDNQLNDNILVLTPIGTKPYSYNIYCLLLVSSNFTIAWIENILLQA